MTCSSVSGKVKHYSSDIHCTTIARKYMGNKELWMAFVDLERLLTGYPEKSYGEH